MITCVENRFPTNQKAEILNVRYIIPPPKFQKLGKFQGSDNDKKEKYLALDFGIFLATLRLNQNIFIINEVRLSSGKVLKGGVDEMGRY